jgi:hypothetical protein
MKDVEHSKAMPRAMVRLRNVAGGVHVIYFSSLAVCA